MRLHNNDIITASVCKLSQYLYLCKMCATILLINDDYHRKPINPQRMEITQCKKDNLCVSTENTAFVK